MSGGGVDASTIRLQSRFQQLAYQWLVMQQMLYAIRLASESTDHILFMTLQVDVQACKDPYPVSRQILT